MQCPRCQQDNPAPAKFCFECGTPLAGSATARPYADLWDENELIRRSLSEALRQQAATSEILEAISEAQIDVQPVLDAIARSTVRLCEGSRSTVWRPEGDLFRAVARCEMTPEGHVVNAPRGEVLDADSLPGRAIRERQIVRVDDVLEDPTVPPKYRERARLRGYRSVLAVPMVHERLVVGVITVVRPASLEFSDQQVGLVKTFADEAVIAIENARLFSETKEALEQQTATADILGVISQSPTDLQPVFEAVAASAARLCNSRDASIFRRDGDVLRLVGHHGAIPIRFTVPVVRGTANGRAVLDGRPVHIVDMPTEVDEFPEGSENARRMGHRTVLTVPLIREGVAIGTIGVRRTEARLFSDRQVALLQTFADQAVIAIENVRLFKELEARNRDLTATGEILQVISRSPTDVQPVFDTIAKSALRLCGAYDSALLLLDGQNLRLVAHDGPIPSISLIPVVHGTVGGRSVLERQPVHVEDVQAEVVAFPEASANARQFGFRTILSVPLLHEDRAIGTLQLRRTELAAFSDKQVALLQTFADQAVIAIENVRLFTELQEKNRALTRAHGQVSEALEQQTATADILRVISNTPTDVQPVFDTIMQNAARLCGAVYGGVYRFDGELIHSVASHNFTPDQLEQWRRLFPRPPVRRLPLDRAIRGGCVVRIPDVEADRDSEYPAETWASQRARGVRSLLIVPMLWKGDVIGAISLAHGEIDAFSDAQVNLLQTFADQAVIAIENTRLFTALQERTGELTRSVEKLTALGEVSRAVSSTLDLETVLDMITERARQLAGADGGAIYEYDEVTEQFHLRATRNVEASLTQTLRATPLGKGEGVVGRAAETREPSQSGDIATPGAYEGQLRDGLIGAGFRALLSVPIVREGRIIGSLSLNRREPGEFSAEVIDVLRTFATQSALAIQNARLFREIEEKSRQLEVASRHKSEFLANMSHELRTPLNAIIGFSEMLRERMFGELNDKQEEYLNDIYASGIHLLSLINDILDLSKVEAGRMELELAEFDLPTALESALTLVRERAGRRGITLQMKVDARLGQVRADERKIRQVVLNLLSNALKFTPEGGRIDVGAVPGDGCVEVSVSDTGIGIAPEDQEQVFEEFRQVGTAAKKVEGTGLGLALCRRFVELHGGRIWVKSQVGVGSTFTFTIPGGGSE